MEMDERCPNGKTVSMLRKLNPLTIADLMELYSLVHKHQMDFWTKSDRKQWIVMVVIEIPCHLTAFAICTIKTKMVQKD